jgi:RNA-directed DNA polymerase
MEDLYSKICDFENIFSAYLKARKCKRYKDEILRFSYKIENNLLNIHYNLLNKKYIHGKYYEFLVSDSKKRIIRAAPFKDRIVHHSLCNIIKPIFEKSFIFDSYACLEGKGSHKAIKRFREFLRTMKLKENLKSYNNIHCLKGDIVKYFDSVDKDILFELIKRRICDEEVLELIKIILDSYPKGLPIGNLTSQLFANIYLHELDFFVKNVLKCKYYIRYMDDFVILDTNKQKL